MATTKFAFLTTPANHSNREIDALLDESTPKARKRLICNKTFLLVFVVSVLICILTGITIAMMVWGDNRSTHTNQDVLNYPVTCCNTFTHQALCAHFNSSCLWSDDEECEFIAIPTLFENDLCFPSIDDDESCPEHELDDESDDIPVFEVRDELLQHSQDQFSSPPQPEVMRVTDGIYVAIGYDLANTIFIETINGIIIIDTLSQTSAARTAFNDYRNLRINQTINNRKASQMLIEAIILTHYHADHVMAISFWVSLNTELGFDTTPKIYANKGIIDGFKDFMIYARTPRSIRAARQFGTIIRDFYDEDLIIDKHLFINAGIGPFLSTKGNFSFINPLNERYFVLLSDEDYTLNIDEVTLNLVHSPGETQDQISIWYQDKQTLFVGDNMYYAFPNIYAIRGSTARDPKKWIHSLDAFITQYTDIQYLVGSHNLPISDNITDELILYRDLIAFVHDQTIRHMTAGLCIDDIVFQVENTHPQILKQGRTQQLYGTIEWSVRSILDLYNGWFDGDSSSLYPSNAYDRGQGLYLLLKKFHHHQYAEEDDMIRVLISYLNDILEGAQHNYQDVEYIAVITKEERWVLEIVTSLASLYSEYKQCEEWNSLMKLRWKIMHKVAGRSMSANGRNYLISQYLEERGFYKTLENENNDNNDDGPMDDYVRNVYMQWPIDWVIELLRYRVNPIEVQDSVKTEWKTNIKFSDSGLMFQLWLRNGGVLGIEEYSSYHESSIKQFDDEASLIYEMNEEDYKMQRNIANISFVSKGTQSQMSEFWSKFDHSTVE